MQLSRNWLREFTDTSAVSDKEFAERMTLSGSKVETVERPGDEIQNVVVGRIGKIERHPDSDHMWICQADVGEKQVQIVTGAWNIHEGDLIPVALDGAVLPGGKTIHAGKLRGVESQGMFCSLGELGLDERDFPSGVITAAALLNDYKPIDPHKPSIPEDIQPGAKIFGPVVCAKIQEAASLGSGAFRTCADIGGATVRPDTRCQNLHAGDLAAYNTKTDSYCTLADLHAEQAEFPHCIPDGIFILSADPELMAMDPKPGDDIHGLLGLTDTIVDFEITPNRPDCLSVIGLAREASATFETELRLHEPVVKGSGGAASDYVSIEITDPVLCPRYTARMVKNVKIAPSPLWLRQRLRASGVRPISNIVDITNYVMLEYGQPMHAFDFSCVKGGKIIVRTAREGEVIQTLDGNDRQLTTNMLCICDEHRPVCVAGVMGGANSEIVGDTAMVLFESANFNGTSVRRTATALGMRTDSSGRFEKGLDVTGTMKAVNRACELVELLGCGEVVDGVVDVYPAPPAERTLPLEPEKINALLGTEVPESDMRRYLEKLSFTLEGNTVHVPSFRQDVERMPDLAEEVARFYGYNNIPSTLQKGAATRGGYSEMQKLEQTLSAAARSVGYSEILTYSFGSPSALNKIRVPEASPLRDQLKILNPLGDDTSVMRTSALPGMLDILARNRANRNDSAKLYELAKVYFKRPDGMADEPKILSLGAYGPDMDFYAFKGAVEALLWSIRAEDVTFTPCADNPSYHPGRCATVESKGKILGVFGQIHPLTAKNYDMDGEVYAAELQMDALAEAATGSATYTPLPRYPAITRDLAIVCDAAVTVAELRGAMLQSGGEILRDVTLFDVYTGAGIPEGQRSTAYSLTFRSDSGTLKDAEADEAVQNILQALAAAYKAIRR